MKVDLPLSERRRIEAEDWRDLRTALVRCHFALMEERKLLAGGVLDHNLRVACVALAVLGNRTPTPTVPAPVAAPEPEPVPVAPPAVVVSERAAPDNLRVRLGLQ